MLVQLFSQTGEIATDSLGVEVFIFNNGSIHEDSVAMSRHRFVKKAAYKCLYLVYIQWRHRHYAIRELDAMPCCVVSVLLFMNTYIFLICILHLF